MTELTGSEILAKSLKNEGTDILFFLMGGPMLLAEFLLHQGRHPSARRAPRTIGRLHGAGLQPVAAKARRVHGGERSRNDQPHHRHRQRLIDCCPVVALGGSSPIGQIGRQVFQEIDQLKP